MSTIQKDFKRLVKKLKSTHGPDIQRALHQLTLDEVDPEFRKCFEFWLSLSGPSRNLLLDVSQGRRLNKRHASEGGNYRVPLKPFSRLSRSGP